MKRLLTLLLCALLLTGCTAREATPTPTSGPVPTVTEAPTLPPVTEPVPMDPLLSVPLERSCINSLALMKDAVLAVSHENWTELALYDPLTLEMLESTVLDCYVSLEDPAVQVGEKGMTYYDSYTRELVFLDTALDEVRRMPVPEGCTDEPALTADRKTLYYLTGDSLRALDLENGMDRLVREMSYSSQMILGLHCDDSILELSICDSHGNWMNVYLSTADGRLLHKAESGTLRTSGDRYFTTVVEGSLTQMLTGLRGGEVKMLHCPYPNAAALPLLAQDAVVTASEQSDGTTMLDYYRLSDGTHPSSLILPAGQYPFSAAGNGDCVWVLTYDEHTGMHFLHRWNLAATEVADDTVYIGIRRTAENPDEFGLERCARYAEDISERYGVSVSIWLDAVSVEPWDYTMEPEYQVVLIENALKSLDRALANYPAGLLEKATAEMGDGKLCIGLVRALWGVADSGALDSASGVQFWDVEGNCHISLQIGYQMDQNLYHELYHVMESRIYSHSLLFDNWNDLNPKGFSYDYEYGNYYYRDDYQWVADDTRAFIDYYCMTYPKEDRARLMEYAMMPENESYFTTDTMQAKLRTLGLAIREAYDLETATESFLWEQYLAEPIHAIG